MATRLLAVPVGRLGVARPPPTLDTRSSRSRVGRAPLRGSSEAWRTRVVVIPLRPRQIQLSLVPAFTRDERWTVTRVEGDVAVALDTGPYRRSLPFGWVVSGGRELLSPEYAPLAGAVVVTPSRRRATRGARQHSPRAQPRGLRSRHSKAIPCCWKRALSPHPSTGHPRG